MNGNNTAPQVTANTTKAQAPPIAPYVGTNTSSANEDVVNAAMWAMNAGPTCPVACGNVETDTKQHNTSDPGIMTREQWHNGGKRGTVNHRNDRFA